MKENMSETPEEVIDDAELDRMIYSTYRLAGIDFTMLLERLSSGEILRRIERLESEEGAR